MLMTCVPNPTAAEEEARVLSVAFAHWPPWKIIEAGAFSGIDVDILQTIGTGLNLRFEFVECPWRRCIELVKLGEVDIITSFGKTPEREELVFYVEPPYAIGTFDFYVEKDAGPRIERYDDLYDLAIGVIKGSVYFDPFDGDPRLRKTEVNLEIQLMKMLQAGRIDVMIGYRTTMDYEIHSQGFAGVFEKTDFHEEMGHGSYLAMSKKSQAVDLLPQLNAAMKQMVETDEMKKIIDRYLQE